MILDDEKAMNLMELYLRSQPNCIVADDFDVDPMSHNTMYENVGLMTRTMHAPAGMATVGKIHDVWGLNILISGSMMVSANPTEKAIRVDAPYVFETGPGSRKFVFRITDCVFMNIFKTEEGETCDDTYDRVMSDSALTKLIGGVK